MKETRTRTLNLYPHIGCQGPTRNERFDAIIKSWVQLGQCALKQRRWWEWKSSPLEYWLSFGVTKLVSESGNFFYTVECKILVPHGGFWLYAPLSASLEGSILRWWCARPFRRIQSTGLWDTIRNFCLCLNLRCVILGIFARSVTKSTHTNESGTFD